MSALLLDTHALLWWQTDSERLSVAARKLIADPSSVIFVSAASAWEIAIKTKLGRLNNAPQAAERFAELLAADGFIHLPITHHHALCAGGLPQAHRDPFDRILAAQAICDGLILVTVDPAFSDFPIETRW